MPDNREIKTTPFYLIKVGNKEFQLCYKPSAQGKANIYFFVSTKARIPDWAHKSPLPSGYEVVIKNGQPRLIKKGDLANQSENPDQG